MVLLFLPRVNTFHFTLSQYIRQCKQEKNESIILYWYIITQMIYIWNSCIKIYNAYVRMLFASIISLKNKILYSIYIKMYIPYLQLFARVICMNSFILFVTINVLTYCIYSQSGYEHESFVILFLLTFILHCII